MFRSAALPRGQLRPTQALRPNHGSLAGQAWKAKKATHSPSNWDTRLCAFLRRAAAFFWGHCLSTIAGAGPGSKGAIFGETNVRYCKLPSGAAIPVLGLGTWRMGDSARRRRAEVTAVRHALAMGYRLIDTAEMYGEGGAETVVGIAVADALRAGELRREELFIVSKVYPHNASRSGTLAACDRSRSRLRLDQIDLYLLHWRGQYRLQETCLAMLQLVADKRIAHWGVSNFDTADMKELLAVERELGLTQNSATGCAANQVYYCLNARGPESSLLPWMRKHHMPLMAYSPIDQGALAAEPALRAMAKHLGASAAQVALAWVLAQDNVVAIAKSVRDAHLRANLAAEQIELSAQDRAELERLFPRPRGKRPLAVV